MSDKPYSPACERNREPILAELQRYIGSAGCSGRIKSHEKPTQLLEVGSGTGQHAVFFSERLKVKNIVWQPSDIAENLGGIHQWRDEFPSAHCLPPLELDLENAIWQPDHYDYVFTANTLHIVSWPLVEKFFAGVSKTLKSGGAAFIYGPFNYKGDYTSASNQDFDAWLKSRDPLSGIRDYEAIVSLAGQQEQSLDIVQDIPMPANNRLLVFQKH